MLFSVPPDRTALVKAITALQNAGGATTATFALGTLLAPTHALHRPAIPAVGLLLEPWWVLTELEALWFNPATFCSVAVFGALLAGDPA